MPTPENALEDVRGKRSLRDLRHAVACHLAFGEGEIEGFCGFGSVGEDYEPVDGDR